MKGNLKIPEAQHSMRSHQSPGTAWLCGGMEGGWGPLLSLSVPLSLSSDDGVRNLRVQREDAGSPYSQVP